MSIDICEFDNDFEASFIELILSSSLIIILQISLFSQTIYYEYIHSKRQSKDERTKKSIRVTWIMLQLCGFYFVFIDLLRYCIDPYTKSIQNNQFACSLVAYSPKIITIIYFGMYLVQVLLRLKISFADSSLAISNTSFIMLAVVIGIPATIIPIIFFVFVDSPCIWHWTPMDIQADDDFFVCDFHTDGPANLAIAIGIIWIVIVNIVYGVIFGVKLNTVFKGSAGAGGAHASFRLKSLIVKNTILTSVGSISTLFNWFMWLVGSGIFGIGISFLYFDMWFNCFIIALMFKYNSNVYKKLCKPCIVCCLMDCDKTFNKKNKDEHDAQYRKLDKYFRRIHDQSKSELSTTNMQSTEATKNNQQHIKTSKPVDSLTTPLSSAKNPMSADINNKNKIEPFELHVDLNINHVHHPQSITPVGSISHDMDFEQDQ